MFTLPKQLWVAKKLNAPILLEAATAQRGSHSAAPTVHIWNNQACTDGEYMWLVPRIMTDRAWRDGKQCHWVCVKDFANKLEVESSFSGYELSLSARLISTGVWSFVSRYIGTPWNRPVLCLSIVFKGL